MKKLLLCALFSWTSIAAAAWPEKPITMIIAYPPGGGTDVAARAMIPYLEKYIGGGARVVILNRAGAGGEVGMAALERAAKVKMVHIPFKGSAEVRAAIAGKQIVVAAMNVGEALQTIRGGIPMRNLGQFGPARADLAPDLPTGREQGFDFEMSALRGLAAPKGLPRDIRERLVKAVERAAADPEFKAQAVKFYAPLRYLPPAEFARVNQEAEKDLRQLWKELPWGEK